MIRTVKTALGAIEYELVQTQRQSMELRLISGGAVRLFTPRRTPLRTADGFVIGRAQWIVDTRRAMREHKERTLAAHPIATGEKVLYEGVPTEIRIVSAARNRIVHMGELILIEATDTAEEAVREQLRRWLTEQARERVTERLAHFAPLVGKAPGRIAIRDQRTRWGSCSSGDNLNFNWKLIMAPPSALDYVVVHELCHLYEFNHSGRFWQRVERHMPDYQDWKNWLKKNGKMLGL